MNRGLIKFMIIWVSKDCWAL